MARGNEYRCRVCNNTYTYCGACAFTPDRELEDNFCSHEHAEIFRILSRNGCHLATAEETLEALEGYDLENLAPSIMAHINSLKAEAEVTADIDEEKEAE